MSFNLSQVIHMISTVDDLLSMSEHPYTIDTSTGYDVKDDREVQFINFTFPLKNGISFIKIYDSVGIVTYKNSNDETVINIEFDDRNVAELNSSFKKAFKQVREFDRQHSSQTKNKDTSIDRASFGLAEVN